MWMLPFEGGHQWLVVAATVPTALLNIVIEPDKVDTLSLSIPSILL